MIPDVYIFILSSLAVFRLGLLTSKEDGPLSIFRKARNEVPKKSSFHKGIRCIWCSTVWYAMAISAYQYQRTHLPVWLTGLGDWFILMLALSAVGLIINQTFTKD